MKRVFKYIFIGTLSLIIILGASIGILCWVVFTPEKITPVVRSQAEKFMTCRTEIDRVELTFFSSFPYFALKAGGIALVNPVPNAPNDTLFSASELTGRVDVEAWWKRNELIVSLVSLKDGRVNIYTDSLGRANYDIVASDDASSETPGGEPLFAIIDISDIELKNLDISYIDKTLMLDAHIGDLNGSLSGTMNPDSVSGLVEIDRSRISLEYAGEKYLDAAVVQLTLPAKFVFSPQSVSLHQAAASVNGLAILVDGSIQYDSTAREITADLSYRQEDWKIRDILHLVPPAFGGYLEGVDADGMLSSSGIIRGVYSDFKMPLMDIQLSLKDGSFGYEGLALPVKDVNAAVRICSDFTTDSLSFIQIDNFSAKTPGSSFATSGKATRLFTDIHCDFATVADLYLDEFDGLIPENLKVALNGRIKGNVGSAFSMSQIEKMALERMRISGSLVLSDFYASYDTIVVQTGYSEIEFALPNPKASSKDARFAFLEIVSDYLTANQERGFDANLQKPHLSLEISDFRDMSRLPDMVFDFQMDSLSAGMDTIRMVMEKPAGKLSMSSGKRKSPEIALAYQSEKVEASAGQNSISIHKLHLDTDALNDSSQTEFMLQWLAKGFVDMEKGVIASPAFAYPVEIPSIEMDFSPEELNIRDSRMRIGDSDFNLSGTIKNVFSYFRGDSLLRGELVFKSDKTDISQLMSLTNGLNNEEADINPEPIENTSSGPYMVPKGVDIHLQADVSAASYGEAAINNIKGNLKIKDGILALEDMVCENAAAKMQLSALYRTPRKNHLQLYLDYHLLEVEIEELLRMIPEIDSMMPMLSSFSGKGEFHFALETYLDSLYNIKLSTLRGASSIRGNDLVLLDGETFSEIAKKLNFNRKTENKVDSLSAEFTIFREEIDVYPFQIVMDKYKAVIEGRHNLDLSFNYHISVVDCPLPLKVGLDVKGTMEDFDISLTKCRYPELYKPVSRKTVDTRRLEIRKMIRESLVRGVVE